MRVILFILTITLLTGCGHKTDLRLPEPDEQAASDTPPPHAGGGWEGGAPSFSNITSRGAG